MAVSRDTIFQSALEPEQTRARLPSALPGICVVFSRVDSVA